MLMKVWIRLHDQRGQGMVEYGLILALVSVAIIAFLGPMADQIGATFEKVKTSLAAAL